MHARVSVVAVDFPIIVFVNIRKRSIYALVETFPPDWLVLCAGRRIRRTNAFALVFSFSLFTIGIL